MYRPFIRVSSFLRVGTPHPEGTPSNRNHLDFRLGMLDTLNVRFHFPFGTGIGVGNFQDPLIVVGKATSTDDR
jgi:hypothetical protein